MNELRCADLRVPTVARLIVAATLIVTAGLKFVLTPPAHDAEIVGLAGLLATRPATLGSAVVESALGLALLSPLRRHVAPILGFWLAGLAGVTLAFLVGGVSLSTCGCAGPLAIPSTARVLTVFALCALSCVWATSPDGRGLGSARQLRA